MQHQMCLSDLRSFAAYLRENEKSPVTIEKYLRDVKVFYGFCGGVVTKESVLAYKAELMNRKYAVSSVNSMLSSINSFLIFSGWAECRVKSIRIQTRVYRSEEQELTREEYQRLLDASRENQQLNLLLQTICATGIRVSELPFFRIEALEQSGAVEVHCKNKTRVVFVPSLLRSRLLKYARKRKLRSGPVFVTRNGKPLDRSNIWQQMKNLCQKAQVNPEKVYPHNLRKLFARTFYSADKDIAKLADILGHGSIETTRIYIMSTGSEHREKIERLNLLM